MIISVVAAIIRRDEKILITRRFDNVHLPGLWEFPGGKVESGESLTHALEREIFEELGITIRVEHEYFTIDHDYPTKSVRLHFFNCSIIEGEPKPIEVADWRWWILRHSRALNSQPRMRSLFCCCAPDLNDPLVERYLAVANADDAVRVCGDIALMGHKDNGVPFSMKPVEEFHDFNAGLRVKVSGRLIGQNNGWMIHQGSRNCHASPFAVESPKPNATSKTRAKKATEVGCNIITNKC